MRAKEQTMRIERSPLSSTSFKGPVNPGLEYWIDANGYNVQVGFHDGSGLHCHIFFNDLPRLLNFYRDLGEAIDFVQPGVINPLPEGDPGEVDAMKVIFEADQIKKGVAV
jgi:hypothetical protein